MPRLKRVVMSGSLGCILGGKDGSWSLPLLRESQFRSLAEFGRRRTRGHDALCRTPITRCSLLQFDLRRRDCWQPLGVDPHQRGSFTASIFQPRWTSVPENGPAPLILPIKRYSSAAYAMATVTADPSLSSRKGLIVKCSCRTALHPPCTTRAATPTCASL